MAQSARGFARDAVIIELARRRHHDVVLHLNGGNFGQFYAKSSGWLKFLIRRQLRRVRAIIVVSERLRDMFSFDANVASHVVVVPNALPEEPPIDLPAKKIPPDGPIRILYLSNLIESKGYLEVLEVVRMLVREHSLPVCATFCGKFLANPSDDLRVKSAEHGETLFREFVAKNNLEQSVQYLGQVSGEAKRRVLIENHFLFLPTRYDNEAQPLSLIEALAHGLVPITTNYRANPDVVIDGVTGHLIDWRDVAGMAHLCERYLRRPDEFAAISERARAHFKEEFSRTAHLKRLFELLEPSR
jgi:glycosyltransferase involved in cell wall biosynthesis